MIVAHWALTNGSGMGRVASELVAAECALGLDARLIDCADPNASCPEADVFVVHTHLNDAAVAARKPMVWFAHGTPEVMFHSGYEQGAVNGAYGHGDAWMMAQYWLQHCDATVTCWPRHQAIWRSLADKRTLVELVPMGVDTAFWEATGSQGRYAGTPSVFTAENCYEMKWPLDLFIAWPWVAAHLPAARLHAIYVPRDQHRWWFPLVNRNGASYKAYIGPHVFDASALRNAFKSTDAYVGLVRYGDLNRVSLEAAASGAKVISYRGNPYASYWVTEGDQRGLAEELIAILRGQVEPRPVPPIPTMQDMATAMRAVYERVM